MCVCVCVYVYVFVVCVCVFCVCVCVFSSCAFGVDVSVWMSAFIFPLCFHPVSAAVRFQIRLPDRTSQARNKEQLQLQVTSLTGNQMTVKAQHAQTFDMARKAYELW